MTPEQQLAAGWRVKAYEIRQLPKNRPMLVSAEDAAAMVARSLEQCALEIEGVQSSKFKVQSAVGAAAAAIEMGVWTKVEGSPQPPEGGTPNTEGGA